MIFVKLFVLGVIILGVHCRPDSLCSNTTRRFSVVITEEICPTERHPLLSQSNTERRRVGRLRGSAKNKPNMPSAPLPQAPQFKLRNRKTTAKEIMKMYPGLFLTKKKATEIQKSLKPQTKKIKPGSILPGIAHKGPTTGKSKVLPGTTGQTDGDIHCPTFRNVQEAPEKMPDFQKKWREVVHFPADGVFQYVHTGKCGGADGVTPCNGGKCHQEKSIVYLMVWTDNIEWPTTFEPFEIDSYCSCKAIQ